MQHGIKTARAGVKRNRELRTVGNDFCGRPRNRSEGRRLQGVIAAYQRSGLSRGGYGVIAFAGANVEPLAADANFDGVIILGAIVATWIVAEGVLVAGLFGDARIKSFE